MKNTVNNAQDFTAMVLEKKAMLQILERLMMSLDSIDKDTHEYWGDTGEMEQKTRWCDEEDKSMPVFIDDNGKDTFEDTGKPRMITKYGTMEKTDFTDEDKATFAALEKVRKALIALA